jgi:hypothetical protein
VFRNLIIAAIIAVSLTGAACADQVDDHIDECISLAPMVTKAGAVVKLALAKEMVSAQNADSYHRRARIADVKDRQETAAMLSRSFAEDMKGGVAQDSTVNCKAFAEGAITLIRVIAESW